MIPAMARITFQSTRPARGATTRHIQRFARTLYFNPRAPRGARQATLEDLQDQLVFQSTRPARGATQSNYDSNYNQKFQSTRPARGATPHHFIIHDLCEISIHAPREGRDTFPTTSALTPTISIHAPREGRDPTQITMEEVTRYFNPRAPRGARQIFRRGYVIHIRFQSTRPARGATLTARTPNHRLEFQSTRPARGATNAHKQP